MGMDRLYSPLIGKWNMPAVYKRSFVKDDPWSHTLNKIMLEFMSDSA